MSLGFAIHNSRTDHGGIIPATQMKASQMGNLFLVAGDGHFCPKCKCWSTIRASHNHIIFYGQPVAYEWDELTCGAKILPMQSHVVGDSGKPYYNIEKSYSNQSINTNINESILEESKIHKVQFQILDEIDQLPVLELLYEIHNKSSGELLVKGFTDENGFTAIYESELTPESVELITLDLSRTIDPI